jgi:hypothetical protein
LNVRLLRLARIAAEAEGLRLRRQVRRAAIRGVLGVIALVWLFGAVAFVHVAVWNWLEASVGWTPLGTAWTLAGGDALIAIGLCLVAALLGPGRVETEALAVRARAVDAATSSLAVSAMLLQAVRVGMDLVRRRRD